MPNANKLPYLTRLDAIARELPEEHRNEIYNVALDSYITGASIGLEMGRGMSGTDMNPVSQQIVKHLQSNSDGRVEVPAFLRPLKSKAVVPE